MYGDAALPVPYRLTAMVPACIVEGSARGTNVVAPDVQGSSTSGKSDTHLLPFCQLEPLSYHAVGLSQRLVINACGAHGRSRRARRTTLRQRGTRLKCCSASRRGRRGGRGTACGCWTASTTAAPTACTCAWCSRCSQCYQCSPVPLDQLLAATSLVRDSATPPAEFCRSLTFPIHMACESAASQNPSEIEQQAGPRIASSVWPAEGGPGILQRVIRLRAVG